MRHFLHALHHLEEGRGHWEHWKHALFLTAVYRVRSWLYVYLSVLLVGAYVTSCILLWFNNSSIFLFPAGGALH